MNPKLTRRQALVAAAGMTASTLVAAQDNIPAGASWVGLTVLPRSIIALGNASTMDMVLAGRARLDPLVLADASYTVKAEKGTEVRVIAGASPVWVERQALVPLADAVEFFDTVIRAIPTEPNAYNYRAWALRLLDKREDAVKGFGEYLKLAPTSASGLSNRGLTYAELGQFDEAFKDFAASVAGRTEGWAQGQCNLGFAHELRGDFEKAIDAYKMAVFAGSTLATNNVAWVLATCPTDKLRDGDSAYRLAKSICESTQNLEGMYLDTLAAALAERGKFEDAVKTQELAHKDKSYDLAYGDEGRARLNLYQQKKPFRTDPTKK